MSILHLAVRLACLCAAAAPCAVAAALQSAAAAAPHGPALETVTVALRSGEPRTAERGVLPVPVVRARPEGGTIQLVFHREHPPIFLLNGGPGFRGLEGELTRAGFYEDNLERLNSVADVVVVGQRGIGSSGPETVCAGPPRVALDAPSDDAAEALALAEAARACRARWEAQGLDLAGLNVLEAAADVIAVADALGYGQLVLVGNSFGSHWAMAILRAHGPRVARALLSGLEGPDHTYDMPSDVLAALRRIAAAAEASVQFAGHVPEGGLVAAFERALHALAVEPRIVELGRVKVVMDVPRLQELALGYTARASSRAGIRTWPLDILRLARGEFDEAARSIVRSKALPSFPTASFWMLDCSSGLSAPRRERMVNDPARAIVGNLGALYDAVCPAFGGDLGESFRLEFETDVPTLLVHGTWDTSTPVENALELAPRFHRSKLVLVEGGSHGAVREALAASAEFADAALGFLATGDLDAVPAEVVLPLLDWEAPEAPAESSSSPGAGPAPTPPSDGEWTDLFNGRDLTGWVNVNTAPSTWQVTPEGSLHCTGKPIGELRTERMYQNFELEVEWRHLATAGNAGIFVWADDITARGVPFHRSIEVQVLENAYGNTESHTTHGDIFPIHGATMVPVNGRGGERAFPTSERSKPAPEWNHYLITCKDGDITLAVNGEVVTRGTQCSPRKGYICLESEGGAVDYKCIRIRALPDTEVAPEHVAVADRGYRSLYNGLDLGGWSVPDAAAQLWLARDWVLTFQGNPTPELDVDVALATARTFSLQPEQRDVGFIVDVNLKASSGVPRIQMLGHEVRLDRADERFAAVLVQGWNRIEGAIVGDTLRLTVNGQSVSTQPVAGPPGGPTPLRLVPAGPVDFANLYLRGVD